MSNNRMKRETRLGLVRHFVTEHKWFIVTMAARVPSYVEGDPRCDRSLAHLAGLEAEVARLEDLTGVKTVNPLKGSKRS